MHPFVALILLAGVAVFVAWFRGAPPAARARVVRRLAIGAGIALALLLLLTGRLHWMFVAAGALFALVQRLRSAAGVYQFFKNAKARTTPDPSDGQHSDIETAYLRMRLDHDSGMMSGDILDGAHKGRTLGDLSLDELLNLLTEIRVNDPQSATLLETYLERTHGDEWREKASESRSVNTPVSGRMTREEACEVLDIPAGAGRDDVIAAHRRLMQKVHPDRGGSTYLAAKLNEAKEVLLAGRRRD